MVDSRTTVNSLAWDVRRDSPLMAAIETTLIVLVFFLLAGTLPPDVNEAHYLAKAKHYWNPQWCAGDHFLESADAHLVFYWSFGWLTRFASLTSVAWIGRYLTWGLLAWAWQRLSRVVIPGRFYSVLSAALFATLVDRGHMAGEWIIGGVEAKGFAYVLLLLAVESLTRNRWRRAIVLSGASAAFHVLVGGWGQATIDLRQFIRHAKELGFDSVMIAGKRPHLSPLDARDDWLEQLTTELDATGLKCPVIAAYTDFGGNVAAEVPYLELQLAYVESLCRIGQRLGTSIVRVFTAYEVANQNPQVTWRQAAACLREACDRAAAFNHTVAIQNHHDVGLHTAALLEFLADIDRPNCKLGFDAWSPGLRGEDLYEAARAAAPHTVITTNADYVRLPRYRYRPELVNYEVATPDLVRAVPFGTGFLDYSAFFRGLRDGGFDGIATYEMCSPIRGGGSLDNLNRYAKTYLNWMREKVLG